MLAVIDDAAGSRQRSGFVKHQPQAGVFDPSHPACVDPMAPRLAIDNTAERPRRQPRHPGDPTPQPRQQAADIEFAAAHPDLEKPRLIEPLLAGRRQPQQCLAERQQIITTVERRGHLHEKDANAGLAWLRQALRYHLICVLAEVGGGENALQLAAHQRLACRFVAAP